MAAATGTMHRNQKDCGHDSAAREDDKDDKDTVDDEADTTAALNHSLSSTDAAAAHGTSCDHMPIDSSSRMEGNCKAPVSQNARSVDGVNESSSCDEAVAFWDPVSMEMLSGWNAAELAPAPAFVIGVMDESNNTDADGASKRPRCRSESADSNSLALVSGAFALGRNRLAALPPLWILG
jgi:hypothetical protein